MIKVKHVILHHSGGTLANHYESTQHLRLADVENSHRPRFNMRSSLGFHTGYTFVYEPDTRIFYQTRAIGEEGAHTIGYNNQIGICILGNYSKRLNDPLFSVDHLTLQIENDVANFLEDLFNGNKRNLIIASGAELTLSMITIKPHRYFHTGHTECFGNFLDDNIFRSAFFRKRYPYHWQKVSATFNFIDNFVPKKDVLGSVVGGLSCVGHL